MIYIPQAHAICPQCQKKGCDNCNQTGFITWEKMNQEKSIPNQLPPWLKVGDLVDFPERGLYQGEVIEVLFQKYNDDRPDLGGEYYYRILFLLKQKRPSGRNKKKEICEPEWKLQVSLV